MEKKFSWFSPLVLIMIGGAIIGFVSTIFLILSNPSRLPQSTQITIPLPPTASVLIRETSESGKERVATQAQNSLAQELGVDKKNIRLVSADVVNWPDTSLGCPQPGRIYAQALTPGYQVLLRVTGKEYDYHADASEQVFLCPRTDK